VTIRLGVSSYPFAKLKEMFNRNATGSSVETTRSIILQNFEVQLKQGQTEGGNRIISWYPEIEIWINSFWNPNE
jgi:hypothetical protein